MKTKNTLAKLIIILIATMMALVPLTLACLIFTGIYWLITWTFSLVFSWKIAIGISLISVILINIFNKKN